MAGSPSPHPPGRLLRLFRFLRAREWELLGGAALSVLCLGAWGFSIDKNVSLIDDFYLALQLFPLESGSKVKDPTWQLNLARYLAPAVAGYAIVRAAAIVLRGHFRSLSLRRKTGHVIVAGLGPEGIQMVRAFTREEIVAVDDDPGQTAIQICEAHGAQPQTASTSAPETWRRLGVHRAKYAFVVLGSDARSVEAGEAALVVAENWRSSEVQIFVQVSEPRLRIHLAAYALMRRETEGPRLEIFDVFDVAARTIVEQRGEFLKRPANQETPPRAIVAGLGRMGQALTLHLALTWQRNRGDKQSRITLALIGEHASEVALQMRRDYPQLGGICEFEPYDESLDKLRLSGEESAFTEAPAALFLCGDDDDEVISPVLAIHQRLERPGVPITVCVTSTAGTLASVLDDLRDPQPVTYSVIAIACAPELVLRGTRELLARATHEDYLHDARLRGEDEHDNPSAVPWDRLSESKRKANRAQADHISVKLADRDCILIPAAFTAAGEEGRIRFSSDEIEVLAVAEHIRWMAEREADGWVYGEVRSDEKKIHPSLVPWDDLSESEKDKDRQAVRDMPQRLERTGFAIVRV